MANPHGDNVNKTAQTEKVEAPGKAAAESAVNTWSKDAAGANSGDKTQQDSVSKKSEEHGFLNIDFKGMGDAFNQAMHGAGDMLANIGKPSPEQIVAEQAKAAREQADKAADATAGNIIDRLNIKQNSYDSTVGDINKELKAMDWAKRQNVLEHLKKKEGFLSPIHVDKKDGDYVVRWGDPGEHIYP